MSANLSVPASPKPVTGFSQGSPFAPAQADAPATLMDVFASLLNAGGAQASAGEGGETAQAAGLTLSNAFATSTAVSASSQSQISLNLPGLPKVDLDVKSETPDGLIARLASLLAGKAPEAEAPHPDTITMAEPVTAAPEVPDDKDQAPSMDAAALLSSLLQALTLLQDHVQKGDTPEPAVVKSIEDKLGALAELMGMPVGDLEDALAPALAPTLSGQLTFDEIARLNAAATAAAPVIPADAGADAVKGAEAATPAAGPAAPAQPGKAPEKTDFDALTARLAELAKALAPTDPALANKLETLSQNLKAASPDLVARLGFDAHLQLADADADAALTTLTTARPADKPVAATPSIAAPVLDLPEVAKPPVEARTAEARPEPVKPEPVKSEPAPVASAKPEVAARSAEAAKPEAVKPRGEPAPQPATAAPAPEARPEQPATNTTAAVPPVRADGLAAGARAVQAAYQTPHTQVNVPQMAYEIVRHVSDGHNRFQIRLDPAELGRIDVRMDIDNKGTLHARLTVERAETLDLLQRDQRALEKALAQAGLDSSKTNLEFSLKQNPFARQDGGQGSGRDAPSFTGGADTMAQAEEPASTIPATLYRGAATASGVNLFV